MLCGNTRSYFFLNALMEIVQLHNQNDSAGQ